MPFNKNDLEIFNKTQYYLSKNVKNFTRLPRTNQFTCVSCGQLACFFMPNTNYSMSCHSCNWKGNLLDAVKLLNLEYKDSTEENIFKYLGFSVILLTVTIPLSVTL